MIKCLKIKFLLGTMIGAAILSLTCSRDHPEVVDDNPTINSLTLLAIYNLDIPEPSGIAYNSKNNNFMVVSDARQDIFIIDSVGMVKGTISTSSSDLEGITLSKNCDTIYVVEETKKLVTTYTSSGTLLGSFSVNVATNPSHALEGITRNNQNGHLIVLNEKLPCMLLEFYGKSEIRRNELSYTTDISDVFFEESSNIYWIVSHEAQKVLKLTSDFNLVSEWTIPVIQAEGITIVQDKIYIVSDSESKMFVFNKPKL
jgi:uncharacterized protein YjiK